MIDGKVRRVPIYDIRKRLKKVGMLHGRKLMELDQLKRRARYHVKEANRFLQLIETRAKELGDYLGDDSESDGQYGVKE